MSIVPPAARAGARGSLEPVGRWLHARGVSANAVTIAGLVVTVAGAALLAAGQPAPAFVVLVAGSIADTLDGQIAKAAGGGTRLGAFLDSTFDRLSDASLAGGAAAYAFSHGDGVLFWSAVLALVSGSLVPYIRAKAESLGLGASVGLAPREARIVLFMIGVAAWAVTANSSLFTAVVAIVALLSSITAVQRLVHVASALRNT